MKWIGIGLVCAALLWFIVSRFRVDGFQSTAPGDTQAALKEEVCNIMKGLQSSIQYKYDNFDSANLSQDTKSLLEVSLKSINDQLAAQGC